MFMDRYFEDCIHYIHSWNPNPDYTREHQYRDELVEYLRKKFDDQSPAISNKRLPISIEHSPSLCDIGIGRKVGIELKNNLKSRKKINTLIEQVVKHREEYEDMIILLVGHTSPDTVEQVKEQVSNIQKAQGYSLQQQRIKIIKKETQKSSKRKRQDKSNQPSGYGYSQPKFEPPNFKPPKYEPPDFDFKFSILYF
jgi:hypothetical protein